MSYLLTHLHSGWAVDQAILSEEARAAAAQYLVQRHPRLTLCCACRTA